jgi:fatty-acyl-CoA synthase
LGSPLDVVAHACQSDGRLVERPYAPGGSGTTRHKQRRQASTHPAVHLAQVVGRPSERYGGEPVAFVELIPGGQATAAELISFCAANVASYKVPREIRFITDWPMSATKIQKFRLRELLL